MAASSGEFRLPSFSLNVKMLFRADVMFDVTCNWIFSSDSCVTFKDDLRFEVKAATRLFVTNSDRSELRRGLRIMDSVMFEKFVFVNVLFAFPSVSIVDGPGRRVKLISDRTKWKQKRKN